MPYFIWPVPGFPRKTSGFRTAERPDHMGIDIGRNINPPQPIEGAEIVAIADGRVSRVVWHHETSGNMVEIEHGGGVVSRVKHNRVNLVSVGQYVRQGEVVATVGDTGRATGPHAHVELLFNGRHVDPSEFLCPSRQEPIAAGVCVELTQVGVPDLPVEPYLGGVFVKEAGLHNASFVGRVFGALARFFNIR